MLEAFAFGDLGRLVCVKVTDEKVAEKHGVEAWPTVQLLDAEGKKVDAFSGAPDDAIKRIADHAGKSAAAADMDLEAAKKSGKPILVVATGLCELGCGGRIQAALDATDLVSQFAVVRGRAVESELTSYVAVLSKDGKSVGEPMGGDVDAATLVSRLKEALR